MSYVTLEVEIDHGQIVPSEPSKVPEKGRGLLTVLESAGEPVKVGKLTALEAFRALQKSLQLDDAKAQAWMDMIGDARR